jgi:hypothetical protein
MGRSHVPTEKPTFPPLNVLRHVRNVLLVVPDVRDVGLARKDDGIPITLN